MLIELEIVDNNVDCQSGMVVVRIISVLMSDF